MPTNYAGIRVRNQESMAVHLYTSIHLYIFTFVQQYICTLHTVFVTRT